MTRERSLRIHMPQSRSSFRYCAHLAYLGVKGEAVVSNPGLVSVGHGGIAVCSVPCKRRVTGSNLPQATAQRSWPSCSVLIHVFVYKEGKWKPDVTNLFLWSYKSQWICFQAKYLSSCGVQNLCRVVLKIKSSRFFDGTLLICYPT